MTIAHFCAIVFVSRPHNKSVRFNHLSVMGQVHSKYLEKKMKFRIIIAVTVAGLLTYLAHSRHTVVHPEATAGHVIALDAVVFLVAGVVSFILTFIVPPKRQKDEHKDKKDTDDEGHCKNTEHCEGCFDGGDIEKMLCHSTQHCSRCSPELRRN